MLLLLLFKYFIIDIIYFCSIAIIVIIIYITIDVIDIDITINVTINVTIDIIIPNYLNIIWMPFTTPTIT